MLFHTRNGSAIVVRLDPPCLGLKINKQYLPCLCLVIAVSLCDGLYIICPIRFGRMNVRTPIIIHSSEARHYINMSSRVMYLIVKSVRILSCRCSYFSRHGPCSSNRAVIMKRFCICSL